MKPLVTNCRTCGRLVEMKDLKGEYYYYCDFCNETVHLNSEYDIQDVVKGQGDMKNKKKNKKKNTGVGRNVPRVNANANVGWDSGITYITNCDKAPENIIVNIDPIVRIKIDSLMEKFPHIEWLAYLIGEGTHVKDIFIPNQEITTASVDNVFCPEYNTLSSIGVIHSHHGMGNGFSGTDDDWINKNHDISLCISVGGINGQVRWKTPCGSTKIVNAKVVLKYGIDFDKESFFKIADDKIKKKTYPVYTGYVGNAGNAGNANGHKYDVNGYPCCYPNHESKVITPVSVSDVDMVGLSDDDLIDLEDVATNIKFEDEITLEEELDRLNVEFTEGKEII